MSTVSAREANQHFSRLLDAAARGEEVTITRRGKPVAKLVPVADEMIDRTKLAETAAERDAILARLREGYPGKTPEPWTRDELYEERLQRFFKDDE